MATTTKESRAEAVEQILASWAIEGFIPDEQYRALVEHYIDGELTTEQMREMVIAQLKAALADESGDSTAA